MGGVSEASEESGEAWEPAVKKLQLTRPMPQLGVTTAVDKRHDLKQPGEERV